MRAAAAGTGATPAQVALAWILHRAPGAIRIPGVRTRARLPESVAAARPALDGSVLDALEAALPPAGVAGERHPERPPALIDRGDTPA